jgi:PAS domain S-box-containing protein/putative nucleotidyltransferase with HDIG domain
MASQVRSLRVLILEDRPTDAELLVLEVRHAGFILDWQRVDTRPDYINAIQTMPEVILADYNLPQFTAMEALHILQEHKLDIPFIVVTGTISEEAAVECMKQGASDYLLKDRLNRLGQAIERALDQKRLRDEKRATEEYYLSLVQNLSDIITVHNADLSISYESPSTANILGNPPGYFVGKTFFDHIHPDDLAGVQKALADVLAKQDGEARLEARLRNAKGEYVDLEIAPNNLLDNASVKGVVLTSRDITERKRAQAELQAAYEATIEGWSRALDLRDKETEGHTQRVTEITLRMARALKMSDEDLVHVRRGALLHDIGKMGVPDNILLKPGPLTEEEWVLMRRHPDYAYQMLYPIEYLRPALDIPYCHHEKFEGSGYPRGLKGKDIPLPARIFAIIDVWDALCSDRPYRKALPEAQVLQYIRDHAGDHFDPDLVAAFMDCLDQIVH